MQSIYVCWFIVIIERIFILMFHKNEYSGMNECAWLGLPFHDSKFWLNECICMNVYDVYV